MTGRIRDDPAVEALDAPTRRHVVSLVDVCQRELWEFQDGTNADPETASDRALTGGNDA